MKRKSKTDIEAEIEAEKQAMQQIENEADAEVKQLKTRFDLEDDIDLALSKYRQMLIRAKQAGRDIERNGLTVADHYGRQRVNPAIVIEKDSIAACMRIIKQLGLVFFEDEEPKTQNKWNRGR